MAKILERRKPGYTCTGKVRVVSLSYAQLEDLLSKTQKKKTQASIRLRMRELEHRPGFAKRAESDADQVADVVVD